ncbi:A-kinase-interacting protein 1 [Diretmus argenteus]
MANQAWLEFSLRRSATLGLEVLERASRRSVDRFQTPTTTDGDALNPVKRTDSDLNDAFETIAAFMAQTTHQCQKFYESGSCSEPSDTERTHVSRFHTHPATGTTPPNRKHDCASAVGEDFYVEVYPGTYAVTAGLPDSNQQTQTVSINAGESVNLTFNL